MSHRLALFDFDGTLADSQDWFLGIFDQVADRFGYRRLAPGDRERLRGLETRAILHDLDVPTWKLPMIAKHVRELARRDIDQIRLFPGAAEMLAELKAGGVQAAVVSSNDEGNVRRVLGPAAAHVAHFACGASLFGKASKIRGVLKAMRADARRDPGRRRDPRRGGGAGCGDRHRTGGVGLRRSGVPASLSPTLFFERMDEIAPALIG